MDGGSKKIKEFKQETVDGKSKKKKSPPALPCGRTLRTQPRSGSARQPVHRSVKTMERSCGVLLTREFSCRESTAPVDLVGRCFRHELGS